MHDLAKIDQSIERLLMASLYGMAPAERHAVLLPLLKQEMDYGCQRNAGFRNYVEHWPGDFNSAGSIANLPYLPVGVFKADPPLSLVAANEVKRTLTSSSTSGQKPSRVVLDAPTARRMTKGLTAIIRNFVGPARRPYLVIDVPENLASRHELSARGAAIQGLGSFATEMLCCLRLDEQGDSKLDLEKLLEFSNKRRDCEVLVYGFTYLIWTHLVRPLQAKGITLDMPKVHVLHSGGWKRLEQQSVTKDVFVREVASIFGTSADRVIDYYGMVENVGVVYPDCEFGNKHVPAFAEVIVRDPLTLDSVKPGQHGLVQVCSVLPTSFPGFLLLTDDMAEVMSYDGCPCGRRGICFRFAGRVPKVELRGCGNLESARSRRFEEPVLHG
jgi:hypothetical protein